MKTKALKIEIARLQDAVLVLKGDNRMMIKQRNIFLFDC